MHSEGDCVRSFLLVFQTKNQKELIIKYGNNITLLSRMTYIARPRWISLCFLDCEDILQNWHGSSNNHSTAWNGIPQMVTRVFYDRQKWYRIKRNRQSISLNHIQLWNAYSWAGPPQKMIYSMRFWSSFWNGAQVCSISNGKGLGGAFIPRMAVTCPITLLPPFWL